MHSIGASIYLEVELENHLKCFGRNQCYPVRTGKGIWWYWATSGSGTGKSVSITMVATVGANCKQNRGGGAIGGMLWYYCSL